MKISKDGFFSVSSGLKIPKEQAEALWSGLEKLDTAESTPFAKWLFYFGAMIVISAMTWFMNLGFELFGGGGMFLIATAYAIFFTLLGSSLWRKNELRIPGGLLITMAVCMVPLAIYGLETIFNLWPSNDQPGHYKDFYDWIEGRWVFMELGTILAGILALRFFSFPFLTAPIYFAAWFLTMDLAPFIFGESLTFNQKSCVSLVLGLVMIAISFVLEGRKKEDYSFWGYLFGVLSFWGGLGCLMWDQSEPVLFIYLIINLLMMVFSVLVRRNVFMVFGAIGVFAYLGHLVHNLFEDSVLFPFALSLIGLGIIYLGVLYQKNLNWIERTLLAALPPSIRDRLSHQNK